MKKMTIITMIFVSLAACSTKTVDKRAEVIPSGETCTSVRETITTYYDGLDSLFEVAKKYPNNKKLREAVIASARADLKWTTAWLYACIGEDANHVVEMNGIVVGIERKIQSLH